MCIRLNVDHECRCRCLGPSGASRAAVVICLIWMPAPKLGFSAKAVWVLNGKASSSAPGVIILPFLLLLIEIFFIQHILFNFFNWFTVHPNPTHLLLHRIHPLPLLPPTQQRRKSHCGGWSATVCLTYTLLAIFLCLQMLIAMTFWYGKRPLASATLLILEFHWISSLISCCCPPCVIEILWLWICKAGPLYPLQQFIDRVGVGMGQCKVLKEFIHIVF